MASSSKRKTTMAKLNRESRLRDRRLEKVARKNARKRAAADERAGLTQPASDVLDADDALEGDEAADAVEPDVAETRAD